MEERKDGWIVCDPKMEYPGTNYPLQSETYDIIGICMEVHRILGPGFQEIIYKDALEQEFNARNIPFVREKKFNVMYKGQVLPHCFYADFVVCGAIILEVKSLVNMSDLFYGQVINYLAASGLDIGLLINFGDRSLKYRRIVFNDKKRNMYIADCQSA